MKLIFRGLLVKSDDVLVIYLSLENTYCLGDTSRLNICISYQDSKLLGYELQFVFLNQIDASHVLFVQIVKIS